ncbi:hypothetical protein O6H91_01G014700 [Diphasiastrum complanatum]|nr:hypothetical protein O6H91_01G014700 [Diphasiastrum complanatum]
MRPGEMLGRLQTPGSMRKAYAAVASCGDGQIRKEEDERIRTEAEKNCAESDDDQLIIGDVFRRIENLGQAFDHANDEAFQPSQLPNDQKVCNGSFLDRPFERNFDRNGNRSSGFQTSCKVTSVYARRRHSSSNDKLHGLNMSSGQQSNDLPASENKAVSLATTSTSLLTESERSIQDLEGGNVSFGINQFDVLSSQGFDGLTNNGSMDVISSNIAYSEIPGYVEAPLTIHVAGPGSETWDDDVVRPIVEAGNSSNLVKQIVGAPSYQTGDVVQDFHLGNGGLVISLQKSTRPNKPPADLIVGCTRLATEMHVASKGCDGIDSQVSSSQHCREEMKWSEYPGRYISLGHFFLQNIRLDVPKLVLDFFGRGLRSLERNLCEEVLRRSYANRVRAQTLIAKQSFCRQLVIDQSFGGDALYSMILEWQSSQFENIMTVKEDRFDKIQHMKLNGGRTEVHDVGIGTGCDAVVFFETGDWPLSLKRSSSCLVMQQKLLYGSAKGFYCNETRSIAAFVRDGDSLQVEFNRSLGIIPIVVKVISGGSACLANILESLREILNGSIIFDSGPVSRCLDEAGISTRRFSQVSMEHSDEVGASTSSAKPTRELVVNKGGSSAGKKNYGRLMETMSLKFAVSEPLNPLMEETWQLLIGKNGFHLSLSHILSIFMARNVAFMLSTSSLYVRINGHRDLVKIGRSIKYAVRAEQMSSNLDVQSISKRRFSHVKKRRRSDKISKCDIYCVTGDLVEGITCADGSADCQDHSKLGKRRKFDTERSNGTIAKADEIHRFFNDVNEQTYGSSASSLGEKTYFITTVSRPNAPKLLRLSSSSEVPTLLHRNFSEERKSNESKQMNICKEVGSSKVTLKPILSRVNGERKQLPRESSVSFHFPHSNHGDEFSDSSPRILDTSGIDEENAMNMNTRGKRHDHKLEFGSAVDDSLQDGRKRRKKVSSFVENELDAREELFGRSDSLYLSSPGNKADGAFENMQYRDSETESLNCTANILFVQNDRGWRELGARVELLLVGNTWVLSIRCHSESLFTHKAEQSVPSASINRYTHAMMWKGGKDWSLEFEDRRQWFIFKEMHQICFQRNTKAASVRHIPIPGVLYVQESLTVNSDHPFVRPEHNYICQKQGEVDAALSCSRAIYDLDSEDEEWLAQGNKESTMMGTGPLLNIRDETLEAIIEKLEKASHINHQDMFSSDEALEICQGLGPADVIKAVHTYWIAKRWSKGMPLVRYFQPAPWERYQRQLQKWEAEVKNMQQDSHLAHRSLSTSFPQRPPWFAFCLRPRGLEVPNKVQKQRSQKKLGSGGTIPRSWASAISLNPVTDGLVGSPVDRRLSDEHPEEHFTGLKNTNSHAFVEDSDFGESFFDLEDASVMNGGKVRPGNGSTYFDKLLSSDTGLKVLRKNSGSGRQRWNGKKAGRKGKKKRIFAMDEDFMPKGRGKSRKRLRMLQNVGISKGIEGHAKVGPSMFTPLSPLSNSMLRSSDLTGSTVPISDLDLEAVALAKAAVARKAAHVAARKRAKAQALYAVADAAMRKAVSAMIAAEVIEAERRAGVASTSQEKQSQLGLLSNKHPHIANDMTDPPSYMGIGSKKKSKLGGGEDFGTERSAPWQQFSKKTVKSSSNMVLRGSSVKKDLMINTEDTLLPIASWSHELGAGIGTKLIHTGEVSPQTSLRHTSGLGTVSDCASRCFEGVA